MNFPITHFILTASMLGLVSGSACPMNCSGVEAYCYTNYARGGSTNVTQCSSAQFTCSCNSVSQITILVAGGTCTPDKSTFDGVDSTCLPRTGVCPVTCETADSQYSSNCLQPLTGVGAAPVCSVNATFSCVQCDGSTLSVSVSPDNEGNCPKQIVQSNFYCRTECFQHGCCSSSTQSCACYANPTLGYWSGSLCTVCTPDYDGTLCTASVGQAKAILNQLGTYTLTMVTPLLGCLVVFVVMSMFRRRWTYDKRPEDFPSHFTDLFVEGKFKDKRVMDRPSRSRGIVNRRSQQAARDTADIQVVL